MLAVPPDLVRRYEALLTQKGVPAEQRPHYGKWLRYYLDFCHKYAFESRDSRSFPAFDDKLRSKNQPEFQRRQAQQAIAIYYEAIVSEERSVVHPAAVVPRGASAQSAGTDDMQGVRPVPAPSEQKAADPPLPQSALSQPATSQTYATSPLSTQSMPIPPRSPNGRAALASGDRVNAALPAIQPPFQAGEVVPTETKTTGVSWVWVYDGLHAAIKVRHYSSKTWDAYKLWTQKFQSFVKSQDARLVSMDDVKRFLTYLAVDKHVAASSQNQAFNALLFLFRHVLEKDFGKVEGVVRAKRRLYIPVVLSRNEVDQVIRNLGYPYGLVAKLLYGCGLRLFECLKLRVQDLNFDMRVLTVHDGKGQKDRMVPMPEALVPELKAQLDKVAQLHGEDLASGYAGAFLPSALAEKYRRASKEWTWQWCFPAKMLTLVPASQEQWRYHLHETHVQKAIAKAARISRIPKRVTAHTFRHSFASHLLQANYDIRTIQELLGHSDVKTTMIYTHTVRSVTLKEAKSPLDF